MSASAMTTFDWLGARTRSDGAADRAQRGLAAAIAADAAARQDDRVYATAWPVRREAECTLYRCRMWDSVRVSDPFLVRAEHRFLAAEPALVLATLAAANEDALNVLRRAHVRGLAVEFNQERHGGWAVASALDRVPAQCAGQCAEGAAGETVQ
jgi:hypothetical protein